MAVHWQWSIASRALIHDANQLYLGMWGHAQIPNISLYYRVRRLDTKRYLLSLREIAQQIVAIF